MFKKSYYEEARKELDLAMLGCFTEAPTKRRRKNVPYWVENDPRTHYKKRDK